MGAINGKEYISRLNRLQNEIWYDGEKVEGPLSEHPAFKGLIRSKAALYDLQHDPNIKEEMTFISPISGETIRLVLSGPEKT